MISFFIEKWISANSDVFQGRFIVPSNLTNRQASSWLDAAARATFHTRVVLRAPWRIRGLHWTTWHSILSYELGNVFQPVFWVFWELFGQLWVTQECYSFHHCFAALWPDELFPLASSLSFVSVTYLTKQPFLPDDSHLLVSRSQNDKHTERWAGRV